MIAAIVLTLVVTAGGTLTSYAYDDDAPLIVRLAYGAATGLVVLSAVGFVLAHFVGISTAAVVASQTFCHFLIPNVHSMSNWTFE